MYRHSFSSTSSSFPGGLVHLIRPKQMFVENMLFAEDPPPPNPNLLDSVVFTMAPGPSAHSQIKCDFSGNSIDTFYILLSKTQVTKPSVSEMNAFGTSIPGSFTTYTFTGLDRNTTYYGWVLVKKTINQQVFESDAMASTPASLKTNATGIDYYSFVVRQKTTGVGGANNFPGLLAIQKMSWNLTPALSVSNLTRSRPISTGPMLNAFDNSASTLITYNNTSYNVGDELFYFASPESVSTFTIDFHRPIYRCGFQIYKNGVLVYTDASVTTSNENPSPFIVTYNV